MRKNKTEENNYRIKGNEILLCCGKANCPSIKVSSENYVIIKDDFGGEVKIPKDRAKMIQGAIEILEARS